MGGRGGGTKKESSEAQTVCAEHEHIFGFSSDPPPIPRGQKEERLLKNRQESKGKIYKREVKEGNKGTFPSLFFC